MLTWLQQPLTPIHPRTSDSPLDAFFEIHVTTATEAARLVDRLLQDPSVEAAYGKPDDELPSM